MAQLMSAKSARPVPSTSSLMAAPGSPLGCAGGRRRTLADASVRGAAHHSARHCTRVGRILDDEDAVDDDGRPRPARVAMRVRVSCLVAEIARIKNGDVRAVTDL